MTWFVFMCVKLENKNWIPIACNIPEELVELERMSARHDIWEDWEWREDWDRVASKSSTARFSSLDGLLRDSNAVPALSDSLGTSMMGGKTEENGKPVYAVCCAALVDEWCVLPKTEVNDGVVSPSRTSMELHCSLLARRSSLFCLRCSPVDNDSQKRTKSKSMWKPYGQHWHPTSLLEDWQHSCVNWGITLNRGKLIMKLTWLLLDTNNVLGLHGRSIGEGGSFVLPRPIVWIVATCE